VQRPTSVTVFGILNIVFATLGVFVVLFSLIMLAMLGRESNNPAIQIMQDEPNYVALLKVLLAIRFFVCAGLLASGIGLLMLKSWARILSILYAIYSFVMIPVVTVLNYIYLTKPIIEQAHQQQGPEAAGAIGGAIGGMVGGCFGLVYPVLLLIFMLRPNVVAAFRSSPSPTL